MCLLMLYALLFFFLALSLFPIRFPRSTPFSPPLFSSRALPQDHRYTSLAKTDRKRQKGTADNFYHQKQLLPENFQKAAEESGAGGGVRVRFQEGYDHSYFTMASFADDHVGFHARYLLG